MTEWWKTEPPKDLRGEFWMGSWFERVKAIRSASGESGPVIRATWSGVMDEEPRNKFIEMVQERLQPVIYHRNPRVQKYNIDDVYVREDCACNVDINDEGFTFKIATDNEALFKELDQYLEKHIYHRSERTGAVYILGIAPMGGLKLYRLGDAGIPLERENYDPEAIEAFDFLREELSSATPTGRLGLLLGPPGTGKTYFVRGLINEVNHTVFVFVPSGMVAHLGDPGFVPALLSTADEEPGSSMVLIVEDADSLLVERQADNISGISSMLNITSGILGDMIDLRVIATSNSNKVDIDKAVTRAGRLSGDEPVTIGPLSEEHAQRVYERLVGPSAGKYTGKPLLGEIYTQARKDGWVPPPKKGRTKEVAEKAAVEDEAGW